MPTPPGHSQAAAARGSLRSRQRLAAIRASGAIWAAFLALLAAASAYADATPRLAQLPFTIINTSPAPLTSEEMARLHRLDAQLHALLDPRYALVDIAPVQDRLARIGSIRGCNGCELDLARSLGAQQVAYGWVQKVSNLILNVNLVIEDANGHVLHADSVDVRGNTDESWSRGLRYLINERIFRADEIDPRER